MPYRRHPFHKNGRVGPISEAVEAATVSLKVRIITSRFATSPPHPGQAPQVLLAPATRSRQRRPGQALQVLLAPATRSNRCLSPFVLQAFRRVSESRWLVLQGFTTESRRHGDHSEAFARRSDGRQEPPVSAFPGGAWERVKVLLALAARRTGVCHPLFCHPLFCKHFSESPRLRG